MEKEKELQTVSEEVSESPYMPDSQASAGEPDRKKTMEKEIPKDETDAIITQHVWASMGMGVIPIPGADLAGLLGVRLNMIRSLTDIYKIPFFDEAVKKILLSLGGMFFLSRTAPLLGSLIKFFPGIGQGIGALGMPVISGVSTYAAGKVLVRHFESGGDLLNFEAQKEKDYYAEMLKEGKSVVKEGGQGSGDSLILNREKRGN